MKRGSSIYSSGSKEIEIKVKLNELDKQLILKWLSIHAKFISRLKQTDYYLDNPHSSFVFLNQKGFRDANQYFRVRSSENGARLCYKKVHRDLDTEECLYCDEYEIEIHNVKQMLKILNAAGFTDVIEVSKERSKYFYAPFEIVLDEVKNIGSFLEVELKSEVEDPKSGLDQLKEFLTKQIGIRELKQQSHGYATMALNPNRNFELPSRR
ncbi:MAG: class IV adenylate cyclase [Chlamydiales bacterium]